MVRELQLEHLADIGAKLVCVDMATHITVADADNREHELAIVSSHLKAIAMRFDIAVVAAWPLGRGPYQRVDARPVITDLRGSGQVAHDADVVLLLYREDLHERESTRPGEADIIVAKHRNGPTAYLTVAFQGHYARFVDMVAGP